MACPSDTLVQDLLRSYADVGGINHLDGTNLPSRDALPAICQGLLTLLFPGFFDDEPLTTACVEKATRTEISRLIERLTVQTARSLHSGGTAGRALEEQARDLVCRFIHQLPEVRQQLLTDVEAAYEGDPAARSFEEIILAYPCIEAIAIQRLAHLLYLENVPLLPRMMTEWAHSRTGIDIHPGARIGSHFFIDHGTGVVIGETCVIGDRVKLYHGVTLGARSFPKDTDGKIVKGIKRHPHVEDDVVIYPNAIILGGDIVIGARSTIGANVFLMKSVPPDTLLVRGEQVQQSHDKRQRARAAGTLAKAAAV